MKISWAGSQSLGTLAGLFIFWWALVGETSCLEAAVKATNETIYNGTAVLLGVSSGIVMEVLKAKDGVPSLASATLPSKANAVTGSSSQDAGGAITINKLDIDFGDQPVSGSNGSTFSGVRLRLEIQIGPLIPGYWSLTAMSADYSVQVDGRQYVRKGDVIAVAPRPGYTSSPDDVSCTRGYTVCAPRLLSWTCDDQTFYSASLWNASGTATDNFGVAVTFLDLELQPFFSNGSAAASKFGYNWDCDPVISVTLWVSLLIPLFLLFVIIWATTMLTSVHTPDKFDNPHGKQIIVPTTE